MSGNYLLYSFCVIANLQLILSARSKVRDIETQPQAPSSYESLKIIPYITERLADRSSSIMIDNIDDQHRDKLLTLLTKTKKEVQDADEFITEVIGVLEDLFARKSTNSGESSKKNKPEDSTEIAWAYYDDNGQ